MICNYAFLRAQKGLPPLCSQMVTDCFISCVPFSLLMHKLPALSGGATVDVAVFPRGCRLPGLVPGSGLKGCVILSVTTFIISWAAVSAAAVQFVVVSLWRSVAEGCSPHICLSWMVQMQSQVILSQSFILCAKILMRPTVLAETLLDVHVMPRTTEAPGNPVLCSLSTRA